MKRHRPWLLLSLLFPFLFSCSSTSPFVSNTTLSESLSIEEKLEAYGGREVYVQEPGMCFQGEEWLIRLEEEVEKADVFVIIGSSLNVYPAAGLIRYAPASARCFLIDPKEVKVHANRPVEVIREVASKGVLTLREMLKTAGGEGD